jgi:hypothetical protein
MAWPCADACRSQSLGARHRFRTRYSADVCCRSTLGAPVRRPGLHPPLASTPRVRATPRSRTPAFPTGRGAPQTANGIPQAVQIVRVQPSLLRCRPSDPGCESLARPTASPGRAAQRAEDGHGLALSGRGSAGMACVPRPAHACPAPGPCGPDRGTPVAPLPPQCARRVAPPRRVAHAQCAPAAFQIGERTRPPFESHILVVGSGSSAFVPQERSPGRYALVWDRLTSVRRGANALVGGRSPYRSCHWLYAPTAARSCSRYVRTPRFGRRAWPRAGGAPRAARSFDITLWPLLPVLAVRTVSLDAAVPVARQTDDLGQEGPRGVRLMLTRPVAQCRCLCLPRCCSRSSEPATRGVPPVRQG